MGLRFPKPQHSVITRYKRRVDEEKALREAYADVDARDGGKCLVTGRYTQPGAVDPRVRREHHHLVKRSLDKGQIAEPRNIVTVCAEAHKLIEAGWLVLEGSDATKAIFCHWAAHVKPSQKPFTIQARKRARED
jgi:hypothetical protein